MSAPEMFCDSCHKPLTSTHVVITITYEGGSPFKNTATRRLAATYGVPERILACLECGVERGKALRPEQG